MSIIRSRIFPYLAAVLLFVIYSITAPQNHSEAEDVYDFALQVEQGSFADQAGVNRVLALPMFGYAYRAAQTFGYSGRAFPFMIFINRLLAVFCLFLFYRLLSYRGRPACPEESGVTAPSYSPSFSTNSGIEALVTASPVPPRAEFSNAARGYSSTPILPNSALLTPVLCLAFSYGFWRYANEAETYILASVFVLGAWCLALRPPSSAFHPPTSVFGLPPSVLRPLSSVLCPLISAIGILVHLLNLIPLLLIIPLYYLLSKDWKKALLHGVLTGLLVLAGYAICSPWLDFSELGAQHHASEGGLTVQNLMRGGIAFGQNLVAANFLFGFESFRELLANLFPSRMLDEEFYMASKMGRWIPWAGSVTVVALLGVGVWVCGKAALECGGSPVRRSLGKGGKTLSAQPDIVGHQEAQETRRRPLPSVLCPLSLSAIVWLLLYALAVIRTEAGSPELWIMALIPFWLLVALLVSEDRGQRAADSLGPPFSVFGLRSSALRSSAWLLVILLFSHNLIAGLMPVMSGKSDYHAQKSVWLLEHATEDDLVLTSYEPILIFYMNYYCRAELINSSEVPVEQMKDELGMSSGNTYAFNTFFQPLKSMRVRSPEMYERMADTGERFLPDFEKIIEDEFGGIYCLRQKGGE